MKKLVQLFDEISQTDGAPKHFTDSLLSLKEQPSWTPAELALLAPLPHDCAYKVAAGLDRLATVVSLLDAAVKDAKLNWNNEFRKERAKQVSFILNEAALSFEKAAQLMQIQIHGHTSPYD